MTLHCIIPSADTLSRWRKTCILYFSMTQRLFTHVFFHVNFFFELHSFVKSVVRWHVSGLLLDTHLSEKRIDQVREKWRSLQSLVVIIANDTLDRMDSASHSICVLKLMKMSFARRRKQRTCPELSGTQGRAQLVVLAAEVGGRWSDEARAFVSQLAKAKARAVPRVLAGRARQAWIGGHQCWLVRLLERLLCPFWTSARCWAQMGTLLPLLTLLLRAATYRGSTLWAGPCSLVCWMWGFCSFITCQKKKNTQSTRFQWDWSLRSFEIVVQIVRSHWSVSSSVGDPSSFFTFSRFLQWFWK